jgi:hypothetical protein
MSSFALKTLPADVRLNGLSRQVFEILAEYTSFPWPVMQAQCRREDVDPSNLGPAELARVIDNLASAVARFTSPENATKVAGALRPLAGSVSRTG